MTDEELDALYKQVAANSHLAALRAIYERGQADHGAAPLQEQPVS